MIKFPRLPCVVEACTRENLFLSSVIKCVLEYNFAYSLSAFPPPPPKERNHNLEEKNSPLEKDSTTLNKPLCEFEIFQSL